MADAGRTEPVIQGVTAPTERGDVPRRPRMLIAAGTAPHNLHNLTQIFEEPKICISHSKTKPMPSDRNMTSRGCFDQNITDVAGHPCTQTMSRRQHASTTVVNNLSPALLVSYDRTPFSSESPAPSRPPPGPWPAPGPPQRRAARRSRSQTRAGQS